jgi:hypothetical protein
MKTYVIMTGVILLAACPAQAVLTDKTFTSSGQILPGEDWANVYIYNDPTVVDMLGGNVDSMASYDASTLNVLDGYVSTLEGYEFSTANIWGGNAYILWAYDGGTVTVAGTGVVSSLSAGGNSGTANVYGGTVEYICPVEHGTVNLYGGFVNDSLSAIDFSVVNVFGYDLRLTSSGGLYGDGQISGFWLDDTPFMIDLNGAETYTHINLIPEPGSLALLAVGALFAKRCC